MSDSRPYTRLTVILAEPARRAMRFAAEATGDTQTDTVNRALQLYDMVVATAQAWPDTAKSLTFEVRDGERLTLLVIPPGHKRRWWWPR